MCNQKKKLYIREVQIVGRTKTIVGVQVLVGFFLAVFWWLKSEMSIARHIRVLNKKGEKKRRRTPVAVEIQPSMNRSNT
jgi:hypothetical protein